MFRFGIVCILLLSCVACFPLFVEKISLQGTGYNKVLRFPRQVSLDNYIILTPDLSSLEFEFSVCTWIKFYGAVSTGVKCWLSYATRTTDANDLLLGSHFYFYENKMSSIAGGFDENSWISLCYTWSSSSNRVQLYKNGIRISEQVAEDEARLRPGGTLVIGQDQDSLGGSFDITQSFPGELYGLQMLDRALTPGEVKKIYDAGMCASSTSLPNSVLDWSDFLAAEKHGAVFEAPAGCSKWDVLSQFIGQEITMGTFGLIKHLNTHFDWLQLITVEEERGLGKRPEDIPVFSHWDILVEFRGQKITEGLINHLKTYFAE